MFVNSVSNSEFKGKVYYDKNLSKPLTNYAEKILDSKVGDQTLRAKLAKKTFDITFFTRSSRKAIYPKLEFYSGFKVLNPKDKKYYNSRVSLRDDLAENAEKISKFLDRMEEYKRSYDGYNTFGEKMRIWRDSLINFLINL